jgi:hypothetical protein
MSAPCAAWCAAETAHRSRLTDISTRNKLSRIDEKLTVLERQGAPRRAAPRASIHHRRSCSHPTSGLSRSCAGPAARAPAARAASRPRRGKRLARSQRRVWLRCSRCHTARVGAEIRHGFGALLLGEPRHEREPLGVRERAPPSSRNESAVRRSASARSQWGVAWRERPSRHSSLSGCFACEFV